jgi:hypothetical protein
MVQLSAPYGGQTPHLNHPSPESFLRSKEFAREDQVCGYRAFVLKRGDANNYSEVWYSPVIGMIPVKVVFHTAGMPEVVDEVIKIEFVPVSDADVKKAEGPVGGMKH